MFAQSLFLEIIGDSLRKYLLIGLNDETWLNLLKGKHT